MIKMSKTITIPKEEYDLLVKCKSIVESDFEEKFSKEFIEDVKKAEQECKNGDSVRVNSKGDVRKHLDSL